MISKQAAISERTSGDWFEKGNNGEIHVKTNIDMREGFRR